MKTQSNKIWQSNNYHRFQNLYKSTIRGLQSETPGLSNRRQGRQ